MPKKKKATQPRAKKSSASSATAATADPHQKERELYKQGILIRGEAAKRGKDGKLPPGVTHEIAKNGDVVRVRYSIV